MASLGTDLLTIYDENKSRAPDLLYDYGIEGWLTDLDGFLLLVRNRFFLGVHTAFVEAIIGALTAKLHTQQQIAETLGLRDRSSIAQMIRSGTMDGTRLTAALHQYPNIKLPSRGLAALYGFARAASFIKALAHKDASIEGSMTPQDFSLLVGVLASTDWLANIANTNPEPIRRIAAKIVAERTIGPVSPLNRNARRPEQYVLKLQELLIAWSEPAVVSVWAIPECIPSDDDAIENDERREMML